MRGLPHYGDETVATLNSLQNRQPKVADPLSFETVTDLHTLFRYLLKNEFLFIIKHPNTHRLFTSWCWDIRFNYRDREVFIPYYSYETFLHQAIERDLSNPYLSIINIGGSKAQIEVRHNFKMNKLILDDRKVDYRRKNICVYQPSTGIYLKLSLESLPYLSHNEFSMYDLLRRHTNYKFLLSEFDLTSKDRYYLNINSKKSREKRIRESRGFKTYSDNYTDLNYQDIRTYVVSPFSDEARQMTTDEDYVTRVYDFESYLYCLFACQAEPTEPDFKQLWRELGVRKRFISLGGTYPLTLKYYYTDKPRNFKKLTYERYIEPSTKQPNKHN